jgi:cytochrome c oxidase assembly factor CtaG
VFGVSLVALNENASFHVRLSRSVSSWRGCRSARWMTGWLAWIGAGMSALEGR